MDQNQDQTQNQVPTPGTDVNTPVQPTQDVPGVVTPPPAPVTDVPGQGVPTPPSDVPGQAPFVPPTGEFPGVPQAPVQDPNQVPQPGPSVPPTPEAPANGGVTQPDVQTPGVGNDQNPVV